MFVKKTSIADTSLLRACGGIVGLFFNYKFYHIFWAEITFFPQGVFLEALLRPRLTETSSVTIFFFSQLCTWGNRKNFLFLNLIGFITFHMKHDGMDRFTPSKMNKNQ